MAPRMRRVKWWGWGLPEEKYPQDALDRLLEYLRARGLRIGEPVGPPEMPSLPASRLTAEDVEVLREASELTIEDEERLFHSLGKGYLDLLDARKGRIEATDAVILPDSVDEVRRVLEVAANRGLAVVPFGGGTSVQGGVRPLRGTHRAVVTVDLRRLNRVLEVDEESLLVRAEAGILGPELEEALQGRGLTMGHYPQSFHFSTLGGWIATRSSGHLSGLYGRIEDMVQSVKVVTPAGEVITKEVPARATGPELRELLVGSEGVLGIIVEAVLRVRQLPEARQERSFLFGSFSQALEATRRLVQADISPALLRVSDEEETGVLLAVAGIETEDDVSIAILGFEGPSAKTSDEMRAALEAWKGSGGLDMGPEAAEAWREEYYRTPYLRDELVARSVLVETLETASSWSRLVALHNAVHETVREAYDEQGIQGLVFCHLSHAYRVGGSLYFTLLAPQLEGREREQWMELKQRATEAILREGGTLSHHHGIGSDHLQWMEAEHGEVALRAFKAIKKVLDPGGHMNPGKLLEDEG
jgi:alkyldihydroxyacetonephosphate synthase